MAKKQLKIISWNVNGINAALKKGFLDAVKENDADIFAIQETKLQPIKLTETMANVIGYKSFWSHSTVKKGYSGVATYTKIPPNEVKFGINIPKFDDEGRILELVFDDFIFFNIYFPNGQMSEERLLYKLEFYDALFDYTDRYKKKGIPLIITGDYNTAHNEIDLKNPKANEKNSGFLRIERDWLDKITKSGYVDTFRYLYPDVEKYSWWTYRFGARAKNVGWRIDYFFVTENIIEKKWVKDAIIDDSIMGSDHCPVGLLLEIP